METWKKQFHNEIKQECLKNPKHIKNSKKILLMPVGTGSGLKEQRESLAHGLQYLIHQVNPNCVIFFGSDESKKTIQSIKEQYFQEQIIKNKNNIKPQFKECLFIKINQIDDFNECFTKFTQAITIFNNSEVIIDYTSGTRTMSIAAAIAGTINKKTLVFVGGKRGEQFIVNKGNESDILSELDKVYDEQSLKLVQDYFNNYRFQSAKQILKNIKIESNSQSPLLTQEKHLKIELLKLLVDAYDSWDSFDHENAYINFNKFLKLLNESSNIDKDKRVLKFFTKNLCNINYAEDMILKVNYESLNKIINTTSINTKDIYLLASLINNSKRRAEEGHYDDAIARLYRATELIAQIRLKEAGVDYNHLTVKQKDKLKSKIILHQNNDGSYNFSGLNNTFKALKNIKPSNKITEYYETSNIQSLIKHRTTSILAHGLEHKENQEFKEYYESVVNLSKILNSDMELYLKNTSFPKFKLE